MTALYTIGHSTHEWGHFLQLLRQHKIEVLADVRSQPYSRFTPQFNREGLSGGLARAGIRYVFLGKELGARRDEPECYINGKVDYDRIAITSAFKQGLERLRSGIAQYRVAIMCAEKDPLECHRTILVARHAKCFAEVSHILADGSIETQEQAEVRLLSEYKMAETDLFTSDLDRLEAAYTKRADAIAYREITESASP
jgi:uncharacterized protein (DUF488 family)